MKINSMIFIFLLFTMNAASCGPKRDFLITINTRLGDIKLILFDDTPLHKENFIQLASAGRYDGTLFHRVMKQFMIQGGDVNQKEGTTPSLDNMIPSEVMDRYIHVRGAVAAASFTNAQKKSSECQFYIVQGRTFTEAQLTTDRTKLNQYFGRLLSNPDYQELRDEIIALQEARDLEALEAKIIEVKPLIEKEYGLDLDLEIDPRRLEAYTSVGGAPHLDGTYTVFGHVISGMDVVDAIAEQQTGPDDKPLEDISMTVTVERMKRSKITKLYGYQFPAHN